MVKHRNKAIRHGYAALSFYGHLSVAQTTDSSQQRCAEEVTTESESGRLRAHISKTRGP